MLLPTLSATTALDHPAFDSCWSTSTRSESALTRSGLAMAGAGGWSSRFSEQQDVRRSVGVRALPLMGMGMHTGNSSCQLAPCATHPHSPSPPSPACDGPAPETRTTRELDQWVGQVGPRRRSRGRQRPRASCAHMCACLLVHGLSESDL